MKPDEVIAYLLEIYLDHLKQGSIYAAQGVRKEMLIWKSLPEYKNLWEYEGDPPTPITVPIEATPVEVEDDVSTTVLEGEKLKEAIRPKRDWSLNGRFSLKHEACINCGTTKNAHFGKGLCSQCYPKRKESREKMEPSQVEFSLQEEPPKKWKKYADVLPCSNVDCEVDGMHPKSGMLEISGLYFCQQACADQHFTA